MKTVTWEKNKTKKTTNTVGTGIPELYILSGYLGVSH